MTDPRRTIMQAAVAAGGASAALMSYAINCEDETEVRVAVNECLGLLLRAALHAIDASGALPGGRERAALRDVIIDYVGDTNGHPPARPPRLAIAGRCRICGCAEENACATAIGEFGAIGCGWADASRTLCDNPDCLAAAAPRELQA